MSKDSKALMTAIHSIVEHQAEKLTIYLRNKKAQIAFDELTEQDKMILESISLTSEQLEIVRKIARDIGRLIVFGTFSIIDGVSYVGTDIPALALVNRETKEDIADQFLHDEFVEHGPV